MLISIVTTIYNSSVYIPEFYNRIKLACEKISLNYEIIFVDDGSPDESLEILKKFRDKDKKITIIELSRNFGHHKAIMTGLNYAQGEYIFLIDSDLEENPELLIDFWQEMQMSKDLDLIYGVQRKRKGKLFEKISGKIFFRTLNFLSDVKITENLMVVRLMTRRYLKNLLRHTERELVFVGLAALTGFKQKIMHVDKGSKGISTYSLKKKITMGLNFVTSLSNRPLAYIFNAGLIITLFSLFYLLYLIFKKIFFGIGVPGWASLIASIWFLGGFIIFCLGVLGIYLSRVFIEVNQRPLTIIKAVYTNNQKSVEHIRDDASTIS